MPGLTEGGTVRRAAPAGGADIPQAQGVIALAGNPNVGKSTVFNALTHLHQHTGNWSGKTVTCAQGQFRWGGALYQLVDLPGTYSLLARSPEEAAARDFLCFGEADGVVVVCDASNLERGLCLVLQVLELTGRVAVCVNLMDEAEKKEIRLDLPKLARLLGIPVVGTAAGRGRGMAELTETMAALAGSGSLGKPAELPYPVPVEAALSVLTPAVERWAAGQLPGRWLALRILEGDEETLEALTARLGGDPRQDPAVSAALTLANARLEEAGLAGEALSDSLAASLADRARRLAASVATPPGANSRSREHTLDRLFTSRLTGVPVMLALLAGIFWLTIQGANYPSELLSQALFWGQDRLSALFHALGAPAWLHGVVVLGAYRVVAWVVSVMLPPMAIFFPLFTLLEDLGYLPRVAFVLDHAFQKARACGKQALSMCMGFGCNAAGVVGCRIIDSPRERILAVVTNSLVPCNGRFPTLIALITMFFAGSTGGLGQTLQAALLLTGVIVLGVVLTFWVSRLLSATLLQGTPSAFTLELPPYRRPRLGQVLVRSVLDRTVCVLGRAAAVAAPAGVLLWLLANVQAGGQSLLAWCTAGLDPLGRLLGMDGAILTAFVLAFPANELVLPILLMTYLSAGTLAGYESLDTLRQLLTANGWTSLTAACTLLFTLLHWPCSTTCLTIARETGSAKWTAVAILVPTLAGTLACSTVAAAARLAGWG